MVIKSQFPGFWGTKYKQSVLRGLESIWAYVKGPCHGYNVTKLSPIRLAYTSVLTQTRTTEWF